MKNKTKQNKTKNKTTTTGTMYTCLEITGENCASVIYCFISWGDCPCFQNCLNFKATFPLISPQVFRILAPNSPQMSEKYDSTFGTKIRVGFNFLFYFIFFFCNFGNGQVVQLVCPTKWSKMFQTIVLMSPFPITGNKMVT